MISARAALTVNYFGVHMPQQFIIRSLYQYSFLWIQEIQMLRFWNHAAGSMEEPNPQSADEAPRPRPPQDEDSRKKEGNTNIQRDF